MRVANLCDKDSIIQVKTDLEKLYVFYIMAVGFMFIIYKEHP